jgi:hypothetical protein
MKNKVPTTRHHPTVVQKLENEATFSKSATYWGTTGYQVYMSLPDAAAAPLRLTTSTATSNL